MLGTQTNKMFLCFGFFISPYINVFSSMEDIALGPSRQGGKPKWFLGWLRKVFLPATKDPISSRLEVFQDTFEKLPDIEESVK